MKKKWKFVARQLITLELNIALRCWMVQQCKVQGNLSPDVFLIKKNILKP
jgi:hypothetical protein